LVLKGRELKQIDFKKEEQGVQALRLLLQVAGQWYYFGHDSQADPILQAARTVLLANDLPPRDQSQLACQYANAVGQAPVEVAQKRLEEIFRQFKGIRDTYTTSGRVRVSQLDVVEAVVLAAVECAARATRREQHLEGTSTQAAAQVQMPREIVNSIGMKFVLIPRGTVVMGSPEGEGGENERPQHEVEITRPFYLGVFPVTQAQWWAVMGTNPSYFCATGDGKDKVPGMNSDDLLGGEVQH
jgi:hypothetical protein